MIHPNDIVFGQKLKTIRLQLNLSQKAVWQELGLKRQQDLSAYENGHKAFNDKMIQKICELFHVSEKEFRKTVTPIDYTDFSENEKKKHSKEDANDIDDKLNSLWQKRVLINLQLENARLKEMLCIAENKITAHAKAEDNSIYVIF